MISALGGALCSNEYSPLEPSSNPSQTNATENSLNRALIMKLLVRNRPFFFFFKLAVEPYGQVILQLQSERKILNTSFYFSKL